MPTAISPPQKRVLADSTSVHQNAVVDPTPHSSKRRKLDLGSSPRKRPGPQRARPNAPGSSNPKSQFEKEVLEKLTQDISELKHKNAERDQEWNRPPLVDFDGRRDALRFQQIEAERGSMAGSKPTVRLFGVTEVSSVTSRAQQGIHVSNRMVIPFFCMSLASCITSMCLRHLRSRARIAQDFARTWSQSWLRMKR